MSVTWEETLDSMRKLTGARGLDGSTATERGAVSIFSPLTCSVIMRTLSGG